MSASKLKLQQIKSENGCVLLASVPGSLLKIEPGTEASFLYTDLVATQELVTTM